MAKLSKEDWAGVRAKWEGDGRDGFDWLSKELGGVVSRQAISKVAKRDGWVKGGEVAQPSVDVAQLKKVAGKVAQPDNKTAGIGDAGGEVTVVAETKTVAPKNLGGRPTKYREEFNEQAYNFCLMGATDERIAELLEVNADTIHQWKLDYPKFSEALKAGKDIADSQVAAALFKSALGMHTITEERSVSNGMGENEIIELTRQIAPNVGAQKVWLLNRQYKKWQDRRVVEQDVTISVIPKEELDAIHTRNLEKQREVMAGIMDRAQRLGIASFIDGDVAG